MPKGGFQTRFHQSFFNILTIAPHWLVLISSILVISKGWVLNVSQLKKK